MSISTLIAEVHACQGCGACLLTCPEHAIRPAAAAAAGRALASPDRCTGCGECVEVCPVDAIVLVERASAPHDRPRRPHRPPHRSRVLPHPARAARHQHACRRTRGPSSSASSMPAPTSTTPPTSSPTKPPAHAAAALAAGAPIVADVEMVAAGITRRDALCAIKDPAAPKLAADHGITRSAAALRIAAEQAGPGAVYVIGCAPDRPVRAHRDRRASPPGARHRAAGRLRRRGGIEGGAAGVRPARGLERLRQGRLGRRRRRTQCSDLRRPGERRQHIMTALLIVGHGTRDAEGAQDFRAFVQRVARRAPQAVEAVDGGFIELSAPPVGEAVTRLVEAGHRRVAAVPLVLVAAGHAKGDIPGSLNRERLRHPGLSFSYGRPLGVHPTVLSLLEARLDTVLPREERADAAVLLVGRGSTDPDANAEVYRAARLLWEGRGIGMVETAFVSLAHPSVEEGLERCRRLGAKRIVVLPYFLFRGVLPDRIVGAGRRLRRRPGHRRLRRARRPGSGTPRRSRRRRHPHELRHLRLPHRHARVRRQGRSRAGAAPPPRRGRPQPRSRPPLPRALAWMRILRHHGDAELREALTSRSAMTSPSTSASRSRHAGSATASPRVSKRWPHTPTRRAATEAVAARHGRAPEEVLLTSGAAEAFVLLARVLRPRHALVVHPQFTEPEAGPARCRPPRRAAHPDRRLHPRPGSRSPPTPTSSCSATRRTRPRSCTPPRPSSASANQAAPSSSTKRSWTGSPARPKPSPPTPTSSSSEA